MKICRASAFQKALLQGVPSSADDGIKQNFVISGDMHLGFSKALLRGVEVIRRQRKERISWKGAWPQLPWGRVTEALNRSPSTVSWNSPP